MGDPDNWRYIWIVVSIAFVVAEIAAVGTFFLLAFGLGAAAAAIAAFAGANLLAQWLVFAVVSTISVALIWPLRRRFNAPGDNPQVGATRFAGREATVLAEIPGGVHETGLVRFDREEWRAETASHSSVPVGAVVRVLSVEGTRLVVEPTDEPTTVMPEVPQRGHQSSDIRQPGAPDTN